MALKKHCSSLSNRVQTLLPHATNTYIPTYYYCMCIYRIVVKKKKSRLPTLVICLRALVRNCLSIFKDNKNVTWVLFKGSNFQD